jgi:hypothetical protein
MQEQTVDAFAVKDCALIAIATGKQAATLREMCDRLPTIDAGSIYSHFWGNVLQPRFEERDYNNDFAAWARRGLHDDTLAERLGVVDPSQYHEMDALRQELIELMEERLDESEYLNWAIATVPFEFIRSQIVVFDTEYRVQQPEDLAELLPQLSTSSIFYHFIDAKRRLPSGLDDFSTWIKSFDEPYHTLLDRLSNIDPYFSTLTGLRQQIADIFHLFFEAPLNVSQHH